MTLPDKDLFLSGYDIHLCIDWYVITDGIPILEGFVIYRHQETRIYIEYMYGFEITIASDRPNQLLLKRTRLTPISE